MAAPTRRPGAIDVAAATVATFSPRGLVPTIDQLRLDLGALARGARGIRPLPYASPDAPPSPPHALVDVDPLAAILPRALFRRIDTARRDVRMIVRGLRGQRAPFVVPRPPRPPARGLSLRIEPSSRGESGASSRGESETSSPPNRRLEVIEVVHETARAITVRLRDPLAPLAFVAGQFLTLELVKDGREVRRSYSLSSSPLDGPSATITIQRIDGGRISTWLHQTLAAGSTLDVVGPQGLFVAPPTTAPRHLVFFAGGSGITPIVSIAETALRSEPGTRATIVHGSRDAGDVLFRARLDALTLTHPGRAHVLRLLERGVADGDRSARAGRPDATTTDALVREFALAARLPGEDAPRFFLCGPAPMMDAVRATLLAHDVQRERIHEERFRSPGGAPVDVSLPTTPQLVTIRRAGVARTVTVEPGKTILEAAITARVPLRSSCAMGGCGACKCQLTSGEVAMEEPNCLTDAERDAGLVLTCVGRPRGPVTLEASDPTSARGAS